MASFSLPAIATALLFLAPLAHPATAQAQASTSGRDATEPVTDLRPSEDWVHVVGPLTLFAAGTGAVVVSAVGFAKDPTIAQLDTGQLVLEQRDTGASHAWLWTGVATLAAGGVWLAVHVLSNRNEEVAIQQPTDNTIRFAPFASPHALGVTLRAPVR